MPVLGNSRFRRLVVTTFSNELSQGIAFVAIPLIVLQLGGSAVVAGWVVFATSAAGIAAQIVSGAVTDRHSPSALLRWGSLVQCAAFGVLVALAVAGQLSPWHLAVFGVVAAVAASLSAPSEQSAIKRIVPEAELPSANALLQAREATAGLLGGPLGGGLLALGLAPVLAVQTALHGLAALAAPQGIPRPRASDDGSTLARDVVSGFRFVWQHEGLRVLVAVASLINLPMAMVPLVLFAHFQAIGVPDLAIGIYASSMAVGIIVGSLFAGRLIARFSLAQLGAACLATLLLTFSLTAVFRDQIWVVCALSALAGLSLPAFNAGIGSYTLLVTPDAMIGRVVAASGVPGMLLMPLGSLLAGYAVELAGVGPALLLASAIAAAPLVVALASRAFRGLPRVLDNGDSPQPASESPGTARPSSSRTSAYG